MNTAFSSRLSVLSCPVSDPGARLSRIGTTRIASRITTKRWPHLLFVILIGLSTFASGPFCSADVLRVSVDDAIQPVTAEYIGRALETAAANHDQTVLIEINTPG